MIDILAAIGLEQMKKLDKHLEIRRHIQKRYNDELSDVLQPPEWSETVQYYCSRVPEEHRDALIDYLKTKMIHTSVHFKPLHMYDILKQKDYPVADTEWKNYCPYQSIQLWMITMLTMLYIGLKSILKSIHKRIKNFMEEIYKIFGTSFINPPAEYFDDKTYPEFQNDLMNLRLYSKPGIK